MRTLQLFLIIGFICTNSQAMIRHNHELHPDIKWCSISVRNGEICGEVKSQEFSYCINAKDECVTISDSMSKEVYHTSSGRTSRPDECQFSGTLVIVISLGAYWHGPTNISQTLLSEYQRQKAYYGELLELAKKEEWMLLHLSNEPKTISTQNDMWLNDVSDKVTFTNIPTKYVAMSAFAHIKKAKELYLSNFSSRNSYLKEFKE